MMLGIHEPVAVEPVGSDGHVHRTGAFHAHHHVEVDTGRSGQVDRVRSARSDRSIMSIMSFMKLAFAGCLVRVDDCTLPADGYVLPPSVT